MTIEIKVGDQVFCKNNNSLGRIVGIDGNFYLTEFDIKPENHYQEPSFFKLDKAIKKLNIDLKDDKFYSWNFSYDLELKNEQLNQADQKLIFTSDKSHDFLGRHITIFYNGKSIDGIIHQFNENNQNYVIRYPPHSGIGVFEALDRRNLVYEEIFYRGGFDYDWIYHNSTLNYKLDPISSDEFKYGDYVYCSKQNVCGKIIGILQKDNKQGGVDINLNQYVVETNIDGKCHTDWLKTLFPEAQNKNLICYRSDEIIKITESEFNTRKKLKHKEGTSFEYDKKLTLSPSSETNVVNFTKPIVNNYYWCTIDNHTTITKFISSNYGFNLFQSFDSSVGVQAGEWSTKEFNKSYTGSNERFFKRPKNKYRTECKPLSIGEIVKYNGTEYPISKIENGKIYLKTPGVDFCIPEFYFINLKVSPFKIGDIVKYQGQEAEIIAKHLTTPIKYCLKFKEKPESLEVFTSKEADYIYTLSPLSFENKIKLEPECFYYWVDAEENNIKLKENKMSSIVEKKISENNKKDDKSISQMSDDELLDFSLYSIEELTQMSEYFIKNKIFPNALMEELRKRVDMSRPPARSRLSSSASASSDKQSTISVIERAKTNSKTVAHKVARMKLTQATKAALIKMFIPENSKKKKAKTKFLEDILRSPEGEGLLQLIIGTAAPHLPMLGDKIINNKHAMAVADDLQTEGSARLIHEFSDKLLQNLGPSFSNILESLNDEDIKPQVRVQASQKAIKSDTTEDFDNEAETKESKKEKN